MNLLQSLGGALAAVLAIVGALWVAKRKGASEAAKTYNERAKADDEKRAAALRARVDAARVQPDDPTKHYRD